MTLLELDAVHVRYGQGRDALMAVDGVSLTIPPRGTLGLVGESGCGKSSLARAITGLEPFVSGTMRFDGDDHTSMRARNSARFRRRAQLVFQDPSASLNPRMTVGELIGEAVLVADRARGQSRDLGETVRELLDMVGIPRAALRRYPHQFSGGQLQRVAIARALAVGADLLVTDEITSSLDVSVQATILNLLRDLQKELELSILFISHDLSTVNYMSDDVAVMYLGRIVEHGPSEEIFRQPKHPYTKALIESIPRVDTGRRPAPVSGDIPDPRRPPAGCRFHPRCPVGPTVFPERHLCYEADPMLDAPLRVHNTACHYPLDNSIQEPSPDQSQRSVQ